MTESLYSLELAPQMLPAWHTVLDDLGWPAAPGVARALGVSRRTIYRWNRRGQAPRAALLALFWMTRWGRSVIHTQAANDAALYFALARSRGEELQRLTVEVASLRALRGPADG